MYNRRGDPYNITQSESFHQASVLKEDITSSTNKEEIIFYKQNYPGINMVNKYGVGFTISELRKYTK